MKSQLNELALFAGAGGGILGGKLLGWRTVCAVEWDAYARDVLVARQNDGCLEAFPIWDDVQTFDGRPWRGSVDVVSGGFPCQDISAAGKGAGIEGERSGMWVEMARIIGEVRPRFAFVENSPMLTSRGLGTCLGDLATLGYHARWGVVGANAAGAPHKRERIWILAHACGEGLQGSEQPGALRDERHGPQAYGSTGECGSLPGSDEPCDFCGYPFDHDALGRYGCPNCYGEGLEEDVADARRTHGQRRPHKCKSANREAAKRDETTNHDQRCCEMGHAAGEGLSDGINRPMGQPGTLAESERSDWWATEPELGRVAHGVACRVDRLRCIGNGQVSGVVPIAWRQLLSQMNERGLATAPQRPDLD